MCQLKLRRDKGEQSINLGPYGAHMESHEKTKVAIGGMNWSIVDMGTQNGFHGRGLPIL